MRVARSITRLAASWREWIAYRAELHLKPYASRGEKAQISRLSQWGQSRALAAILMISYIQPFEDGNKRAGRLLGNAILASENCCMLSYRSVTVRRYKEALMIFYEQNSALSFKDLFIEQLLFACDTYFRA